MKKRILALMLGVMLIMSLAALGACNGNGEANGGNGYANGENGYEEDEQITVTVNVRAVGPYGEILNESVTITDYSRNITALRATEAAASDAAVTLVVTELVDQIGDIVTGFAYDAENGEEEPDYWFWEFSLNGNPADYGASATFISDGDTIEWNFVIADF